MIPIRSELLKKSKEIVCSHKLSFVFIILFGLHACWIAFLAFYPLPFDESVHFALLNFYAGHISPIIYQQPPELSIVGDATRYSSYLYHYIMSFPLRGISLFTSDQTTQIALLRLINVGFVVGALLIFQRVLMKAKFRQVTINASILVYCLFPVTSLLAATINYDNLLLLFFAVFIMLAQHLLESIRNNKPIRLLDCMLLGAIGLLGCLVKFTFLPIFAAGMLYVGIMILKSRSWPKAPGIRNHRSSTIFALVALLSLVSIGLFAERYGGNIARYGSLSPECTEVQQLKVCLQNGPWARNYSLQQAAPSDTDFEGRSPAGYFVNLWTPLMIKGLGFVGSTEDEMIDPPLVVKALITTLIIVVGTGIAIAAVRFRRDKFVMFILFVSTVYIGALLYRNYSEFIELHELVAVQGRYVTLLLIPLIAIGIKGLLSIDRLRIASVGMIGLVVVGLTVFNPHVVYIRQSEADWYRDEPIVQNIFSFEKRVFGSTYEWER